MREPAPRDRSPSAPRTSAEVSMSTTAPVATVAVVPPPPPPDVRVGDAVDAGCCTSARLPMTTRAARTATAAAIQGARRRGRRGGGGGAGRPAAYPAHGSCGCAITRSYPTNAENHLCADPEFPERSPTFPVDHLLGGPASRVIDRGERPVRRVAEGDEPDAEAAGRQPEGASRQVLIVDRGVGAPDPQVGRGHHQLQRGLTHVVEDPV